MEFTLNEKNLSYGTRLWTGYCPGTLSPEEVERIVSAFCARYTRLVRVSNKEGQECLAFLKWNAKPSGNVVVWRNGTVVVTNLPGFEGKLDI